MNIELKNGLPFIDKTTTAHECLKQMIDSAPDIYDLCLETTTFAYYFNQIVNRAIVYEIIKKSPDVILVSK